MWVTKRTLIWSTILQVAPIACADNAGLIGPSSPLTQDTSGRPLSHVDYLRSGVLAIREKSVGAEPAFRAEAVDAHSKLTPPTISPPEGLHWAFSEQRPALEYQFSNQATMHFHLSKRRATAAVVWNF